MNSTQDATDALAGTVKGPGERPHEFLFITADNRRTRVGEFVYYTVRDGERERRIIGNITSRRLVRNLPDAFLSDPQTPPAVVSSLIGLDGEGCELYEITVESIGYFSERLGDFVNPRIPPRPGDPVFLASSGAGKSYTAGVIVEELMMPYNRAAVLVVDPHGEYDTLRSIETDPSFRSGEGGTAYAPEVKIFTHDRVRVRFSSLTEAD